MTPEQELNLNYIIKEYVSDYWTNKKTSALIYQIFIASLTIVFHICIQLKKKINTNDFNLIMIEKNFRKINTDEPNQLGCVHNKLVKC